MSSTHHRVRGTFVSALQDLVPVFAVQPLQIAAVKHPEISTKAIAKRPPAKRRPKRHINDQLAGKAH